MTPEQLGAMRASAALRESADVNHGPNKSIS
jgi:hypothetical protein